MAERHTRRLTPAQFDTANRVFFRVYQTANLIHKNGARYVGEFGATTQQWAVLGALARPMVRNNGVSVKQLIMFLQLSRQNLTLVLDRLEARSWIERVQDAEDRRSRRIRLTPAGQQIWQAMQDPIERFYEGAMAQLGEEEQVQLFHLLEKLRAGLSAL